MAIRIPGQARPENDGTLLTNATPVAAEWFKPRKAERPNWRKWRNMPAVELWQAVALSLGIEPPEYHPRGTIPDFDEREDVVLRCLALGDLCAVERDESRPHCSLVRLTDIAAVAESLPDPWPLPDEFPRPSAAPAANAPPPSQANQGEAAPAADRPTSSAPERSRIDSIQIEIDDVIAGLEQRGEPATPAKVMARLRERAGKLDSCISECAPDGVIWIRGTTGKPAKLTMEALKQRISRLRKGR